MGCRRRRRGRASTLTLLSRPTSDRSGLGAGTRPVHCDACPGGLSACLVALPGGAPSPATASRRRSHLALRAAAAAGGDRRRPRPGCSAWRDVRRQLAVRDAARSRSTTAARRRDRRPRGRRGSAPRDPSPAPRLARRQLRRSRRRRAPRRCRLRRTPIPAAVRDRFDLVSFDPRGTGELASRSTASTTPPPTGCTPRTRRPTPTPTSVVLRRARTNPVDVVARCVARNGAWLAAGRDPQRGPRPRPAPCRARRRHADVPRLLVRHGDRRGVRADVPRPRSGAWCSTRRSTCRRRRARGARGNAQGFEQALDDFLADCAARTSCAFHSRRRPDGARSTSLAATASSAACSSARRPRHRRSRRGSRGRGVLHRARSPRSTTSQYGWPALADGLRRRRAAATARCCLASPTATTGGATDGTYDNINEVDRRDPLRRPRDADAVASTSTAAEYDRRLGAVPVARRLRRQHRRSAATPASPPPRRRGRRRRPRRRTRRRSSSSGRPTTRPRPTRAREDLSARIAGSRLLTFDSTEHTAYAKRSLHRPARRRLPRSRGTAARREGTHLSRPCSQLDAGDVLPRHVARRVGLLREPEHALTEDVAHDRSTCRPRSCWPARAGSRARRCAASSVGAAPTKPNVALAGERLALPRDPVDALEVDGELLEPLVELRLLQLGDRALGPGLARRCGAGRRRAGCSSAMSWWSIHAAASRWRSSGSVDRAVPVDEPVDRAAADGVAADRARRPTARPARS